MGSSSVKKTPSKKGRSPAMEYRSRSKTLKVEQSSPLSRRSSKSIDHAGPPSEGSFTHALPTQEQRKNNGRVPGRSLIKWSRPRMSEKLLLHLQYECTRHRVQLPWDAIAHRLHPGSSGTAVVQHINRVRKELIAEGHLVPPVAQKLPSGGPPVDPNIRGYVRLYPDGDDTESTRAVGFEEKIEDPKFNLPSFVLAEDYQPDYDAEMLIDEDDGGYFPESPSPSPRRQRPMNDASIDNEIQADGSPAFHLGDSSHPAGDTYADDHPPHRFRPNISFPPMGHIRLQSDEEISSEITEPWDWYYSGVQRPSQYEYTNNTKMPPPLYAWGPHGFMPYPLGYHMAPPINDTDGQAEPPSSPVELKSVETMSSSMARSGLPDATDVNASNNGDIEKVECKLDQDSPQDPALGNLMVDALLPSEVATDLEM